MTDLSYAFTIYFVTLGPVKTIPAFFQATNGADRRTILALAARSATVATAVALFAALFASGVLVTWRVSVEAVAIAGGLVLLMTSIRTLSRFGPSEAAPPLEPGSTQSAPSFDTSWTGRPVLSPLAIPAIVPPVGIVAILLFTALAAGDVTVQASLIGVLLVVMGSNFVAMLCAGSIMRMIGVPVFQVVGWVFSALQAGLATQAIINSVRGLNL